MEQTVEFGPISRAHRWARPVPETAVEDTPGPGLSFKLVILFLLILYSNIAVWYKPIEILRPALVVALGAILMLIVELGRTRQSFRLSRPQGFLLVGFLAVCFVSSFDAFWPRLAFERTSDVLKIVLIYVAIENTVTSETRLHKILMTMAIGGFFPAIGTIQHFVSGVLKEGRATWIGVFANANEDAYALVILMPIAAVVAAKSRNTIRLALWGAMAAYLLAIFFTYSRGGLIGLFAVS